MIFNSRLALAATATAVAAVANAQTHNYHNSRTMSTTMGNSVGSANWTGKASHSSSNQASSTYLGATSGVSQASATVANGMVRLTAGATAYAMSALPNGMENWSGAFAGSSAEYVDQIRIGGTSGGTARVKMTMSPTTYIGATSGGINRSHYNAQIIVWGHGILASSADLTGTTNTQTIEFNVAQNSTIDLTASFALSVGAQTKLGLGTQSASASLLMRPATIQVTNTLGQSLGFSSGMGMNYGVQAVPEPASMAALGLGALGLLKRRRK